MSSSIIIAMTVSGLRLLTANYAACPGLTARSGQGTDRMKAGSAGAGEQGFAIWEQFPGPEQWGRSENSLA